MKQEGLVVMSYKQQTLENLKAFIEVSVNAGSKQTKAQSCYLGLSNQQVHCRTELKSSRGLWITSKLFWMHLINFVNKRPGLKHQREWWVGYERRPPN